MRKKLYKVIIKELRELKEDIERFEDKNLRERIFFRRVNYIDGFIYGCAVCNNREITLNMLNLYIAYKQALYTTYIQ